MLTAQLGKDAPEGQCLVRGEHSAGDNVKRRIRGSPKDIRKPVAEQRFHPRNLFLHGAPLIQEENERQPRPGRLCSTGRYPWLRAHGYLGAEITPKQGFSPGLFNTQGIEHQFPLKPTCSGSSRSLQKVFHHF